VYGTVRTVVWEDGGGNPASYPKCARHGAWRESAICLTVVVKQ
jgi:hypothetical protein